MDSSCSWLIPSINRDGYEPTGGFNETLKDSNKTRYEGKEKHSGSRLSDGICCLLLGIFNNSEGLNDTHLESQSSRTAKKLNKNTHFHSFFLELRQLLMEICSLNNSFSFKIKDIVNFLMIVGRNTTLTCYKPKYHIQEHKFIKFIILMFLAVKLIY